MFFWMRKFVTTIGVLLLIGSFLNPLYAGIQSINEAGAHEAFVTSVKGALILNNVAVQPPPSITEMPPPQHNVEGRWISGYWFWSPRQNDFVWMSGVWRIPPPGMKWIQGKWLKIGDGWIRLNGFWHSKDADKIEYIDIPPNAPKMETPSPPANENSFWIPGYWHYRPEVKQYEQVKSEWKDFDPAVAWGPARYEWMAGGWQTYNPNWVLVPAHYEWSEKGYVFVAPYWDWPLDLRGRSYSSIYIEPTSRSDVVIYEPMEVVGPGELLKQLCLVNPDYLYACLHHYYYYPDMFKDISPPWFAWNTWSGLSWADQWSLWWWYTHPGYPQPAWMTKELSEKIAMPSSQLIQFMSSVEPPALVTPEGVASIDLFTHAALIGKNLLKMPLTIPANHKTLEVFKQRLGLARPKTIFKPLGKNKVINAVAVPINEQPKVPLFKKENQKTSVDKTEMVLPPLPAVSRVPDVEIEKPAKVQKKPPEIIKAYDWHDRPDIPKVQEKPVQIPAKSTPVITPPKPRVYIVPERPPTRMPPPRRPMGYPQQGRG